MDHSGIVDLPIVIILSIMLGLIAISIGYTGLNQVESMTKERQEIRSFNRFVEESKTVKRGFPNESKQVEISFDSSRLVFENRLVRLVRNGEVKRVTEFPIPFYKDNSSEFFLEGGNYEIELSDSLSTSLVFKISEI